MILTLILLITISLILVDQCQLGRILRTHMDCTIWRGMFLNGVGIGMDLLQNLVRLTLEGQCMGVAEFFAVVDGVLIQF